jgi:hypothetical protein
VWFVSAWFVFVRGGASAAQAAFLTELFFAVVCVRRIPKGIR